MHTALTFRLRGPASPFSPAPRRQGLRSRGGLHAGRRKVSRTQIGPLDSLGRRIPLHGKRKGVPQECPLGVLSAGLAGWWRQTLPLPFPLPPWASLLAGVQGTGGRGGCSEEPTCWAPTRKNSVWGRVSLSDFAESPGGGHNEPAVCCMLKERCRATWWRLRSGWKREGARCWPRGTWVR